MAVSTCWTIAFCFCSCMLWTTTFGHHEPPRFDTSQPLTFSPSADGTLDLEFHVFTHSTYIKNCWVQRNPVAALPFTYKYCNSPGRSEIVGSPPSCALRATFRAARGAKISGPFTLYLVNGAGTDHVNFSVVPSSGSDIVTLTDRTTTERYYEGTTEHLTTDNIVTGAPDEVSTCTKPSPGDAIDGEQEASRNSDDLPFSSKTSFFLLLGGLGVVVLLVIVVGAVLGVLIKRRGGAAVRRRRQSGDAGTMDQRLSSYAYCTRVSRTPPVAYAQTEDIYTEINDDDGCDDDDDCGDKSESRPGPFNNNDDNGVDVDASSPPPCCRGRGPKGEERGPRPLMTTNNPPVDHTAGQAAGSGQLLPSDYIHPTFH